MTNVVLILALTAIAAAPAAQAPAQAGGQAAPGAAAPSAETQPPPSQPQQPASAPQSSAPQSSAPTAPSPAPIPPVAVPATLAAPTPLSDAAIQRRIEEIRAMEVVLAQKVSDSADRIAAMMRAVDPAVMLLTGALRARGFILEGYGVFFDVDIPAVRPSVAWVVRNSQQRDQPVAQMPRGGSGPQRTSETVVTSDAAVMSAFLDNPDRHYVESVKTALINAMLEYSKPMGLQAHEWLTVAARDSGGPFFPGDASPTMMLSVKGADLADYLAGRITVEEARKRVEVRKF